MNENQGVYGKNASSTPRRASKREKKVCFVLDKGRIEKNMMLTPRKMKKAGRSIVIFFYTPLSSLSVTRK